MYFSNWSLSQYKLDTQHPLTKAPELKCIACAEVLPFVCLTAPITNDINASSFCVRTDVSELFPVL